MKPLLFEKPKRLEWRFIANGLVLIFLAEPQSEQSTFSNPSNTPLPLRLCEGDFCFGSGFAEFGFFFGGGGVFAGSGVIQLARQNPKISVLYEAW